MRDSFDNVCKSKSPMGLLEFLAKEQNTCISTLRLNEKNRMEAFKRIPFIKHNYSSLEVIKTYEYLTDF